METPPPRFAADQTASGKTNPETNFLSRWRDWYDILPFLRLVRVCRLVGSPIWLGGVGIVTTVWMIGISWGGLQTPPLGWGTASIGDWIVPPPSLLDLNGVRNESAPPLGFSGRHVWSVVWSLICWTPTSLVLVRLGALLTAGKMLPSTVASLRMGLRQTPSAWVASCLPTFCVLPLAGIVFAMDGVSRWLGHPAWFAWTIGPFAMVFLVLIGVTLLVAKVAVPLAWVAIATTERADPLDATSRGFEYTLRRFPELVFHSLFAAVLATGLFQASRGVVWSVYQAMRTIMPSADAASAPQTTLASMLMGGLGYLPGVVLMTVSWGLVGGVYLLLRQSAGGQEIEDVWVGPPSKPLELPPIFRGDSKADEK